MLVEEVEQDVALDLQEAAIDLINLGGAIGHLNLNEDKSDPVSGLGGSSSSIKIKYFREFYKDTELIEGRIIRGDAIIYVVLEDEPSEAYSFTDSKGKEWNIVDITPPEAQDMDVVYIIHIRK